jgi:hypothetical protein
MPALAATGAPLPPRLDRTEIPFILELAQVSQMEAQRVYVVVQLR